jgi:hypothetical protein
MCACQQDDLFAALDGRGTAFHPALRPMVETHPVTIDRIAGASYTPAQLHALHEQFEVVLCRQENRRQIGLLLAERTGLDRGLRTQGAVTHFWVRAWANSEENASRLQDLLDHLVRQAADEIPR